MAPLAVGTLVGIQTQKKDRNAIEKREYRPQWAQNPAPWSSHEENRHEKKHQYR
jgi:hypothetical protein